jgi:hypothetical protein
VGRRVRSSAIELREKCRKLGVDPEEGLAAMGQEWKSRGDKLLARFDDEVANASKLKATRKRGAKKAAAKRPGTEDKPLDAQGRMGLLREAREAHRFASDCFSDLIPYLLPKLKSIEIAGDFETRQIFMLGLSSAIDQALGSGLDQLSPDQLAQLATARAHLDAGVEVIELAEDGCEVPGSQDGSVPWAVQHPDGTDAAKGEHLEGTALPEPAVRSAHREDPAGAIDVEAAEPDVDEAAEPSSLRSRSSAGLPPVVDRDPASYVPATDIRRPVIPRNVAETGLVGTNGDGVEARWIERPAPRPGGGAMSAAEYWTGGGHERSLENERQFQARRKAGDAKQRGQEMPNSG